MTFPRSTCSWSTTCLCTLALSPGTGSDLPPQHLAESPHKVTPSPLQALWGLASSQGTPCPCTAPSRGLLQTFAIQHFNLCCDRALVLHFPGVEFPPVLGIQMFCFDKACSGSCWEEKFVEHRDAALPWGISKNPAFLLAKAAK